MLPWTIARANIGLSSFFIPCLRIRWNYVGALIYMKAAHSLLPTNSWETEYGLCLDVYFQLAQGRNLIFIAHTSHDMKRTVYDTDS